MEQALRASVSCLLFTGPSARLLSFKVVLSWHSWLSVFRSPVTLCIGRVWPRLQALDFPPDWIVPASRREPGSISFCISSAVSPGRQLFLFLKDVFVFPLALLRPRAFSPGLSWAPLWRWRAGSLQQFLLRSAGSGALAPYLRCTGSVILRLVGSPWTEDPPGSPALAGGLPAAEPPGRPGSPSPLP